MTGWADANRARSRPEAAGDAHPEELVDDLHRRARRSVELGGELGRFDSQAFGESDERLAHGREERRRTPRPPHGPSRTRVASARPTAGRPAAGSRTALWPPRCHRTRPGRLRCGSPGTRPASARARSTPAPTPRAARRSGRSAKRSPAEASVRTATTMTPTRATNARCRRGGGGDIPTRGGSAGALRDVPVPTDRSPDVSLPARGRGSSRTRQSMRTPGPPRLPDRA